jgi:beta-lactamase superfamily II metal-dependent hydrolase
VRIFFLKLYNKFLIFIHIQLFITLISLPFLIWWGLPLSLASPLGNLIFAPFLTLFLLLSSIIFFCELFYIPNNLLIILLEHITHFWLAICQMGSRSWLIALKKPSLIIILLIFITAFAILHHKKLGDIRINTLMLLCLFSFSCVYLKNNPGCDIRTNFIACAKGRLEIIQTSTQTILIDPGVLGTRISAPQFVLYNLVPELTKQGINYIDYVITNNISVMTFRALAQLCRKIIIKKIYMPAWIGTENYNQIWQAWEELLAISKKCNTQIILLEKDIITLNIEKNNTITLTPGY